MLSPFFHPIHLAEFLPVVLEFVFGAVQEVTDLDVATFILLICRLESLLHTGRYLLQRHPLTAVWIGL